MGASLSRIAAITGIGHTDYATDHKTVLGGTKPHNALGYTAIGFTRALADAGIERDEIDGLMVSFGTPYERVSEILGLNVKWGVSNDPMMGMQEAVSAIAAGRCEVVALVYGTEQRSAGMNYGGTNPVGGAGFLNLVFHAPWGFTSQGALYAIQFQRYMWERGYTNADLGEIAVAQRFAASLNPHAIMRKPVTIEDYLASPWVVEPLHRLDYCLINDGGVSLILMSAERAERAAKKSGKKPVYIHGIGRYDLNRKASSLEPRFDGYYAPAEENAGHQAFHMAGVGPKDMDCLQIYDSFSPHVMMALEGYGYCADGDVPKLFRETGIALGGGLPINTSGGHLSESYMQGWGHQIEAVRQIRGECGDRQVPDCRFVHMSSDVAGKAVSIIYGN